jgi:hypothetical protein
MYSNNCKFNSTYYHTVLQMLSPSSISFDFFIEIKADEP